MTSISAPSWRCALVRHHYLPVNDDNPENVGSYHLECTRCGHLKEIDRYEPSSGTWMAKGNISGF